MNLKGLREKFHEYDSKVSSLFHKDEEDMKKPSWVRIIPTWLGLIIILIVAGSVVNTLLTVEVNEELIPSYSGYNLRYSSYKSSSIYIYSVSGDSPNMDAYHIAYDGRIKIDLDTTDIPHSNYFGEIMESYLNGKNEYNASVNIELTAYDSDDNEIDTSYTMRLNNTNSDMLFESFELLNFKDLKFDFKNGILTIAHSTNDKRISDSPINNSLENIDHIEGVIHVYNINALEPSDSGYYNYTLNFTIPKTAINVRSS